MSDGFKQMIRAGYELAEGSLREEGKFGMFAIAADAENGALFAEFDENLVGVPAFEQHVKETFGFPHLILFTGINDQQDCIICIANQTATSSRVMVNAIESMDGNLKLKRTVVYPREKFAFV